MSNCSRPWTNLYKATEPGHQSLEKFAAELMDWYTNLDCGIYVLIHDLCVSLYRYQGDRDGIIKEGIYRWEWGCITRAASGVGRTVHCSFTSRTK